MALRPEDVRSLEILSSVLRGEGWTFVVIGATVPWILATRSTGLRGTRDIDVVVNTTSWDDFERAGSRLCDAGFTRRHLHEFISPHGTRIDLLPVRSGTRSGRHDRLARWSDDERPRPGRGLRLGRGAPDHGGPFRSCGHRSGLCTAKSRRVHGPTNRAKQGSRRPDRYLRPLRGGGRPPVRALRRQRRQFATPVRGSGSLLARY